MDKLTNPQKRQLAERLFVQTDLSQKEIAADLDVSEKSLSKWKTEGKWDQLKAAATTGTSNLVKALLEENQGIVDDARQEKRRINSKEADIISKNASTIERLDKKLNLVTVIEVFTNYNKWLVERNPQLASQNTDWQRKYLATLTK
jgi:uncharacterized protein YjcR